MSKSTVKTSSIKEKRFKLGRLEGYCKEHHWNQGMQVPVKTIAFAGEKPAVIKTGSSERGKTKEFPRKCCHNSQAGFAADYSPGANCAPGGQQ